MTEEFWSGIRDNVCAWPSFEPILPTGDSIREVYVERRRRELAKAERKAARPRARPALNRGPTPLEPAILGT